MSLGIKDPNIMSSDAFDYPQVSALRRKHKGGGDFSCLGSCFLGLGKKQREGAVNPSCHGQPWSSGREGMEQHTHTKAQGQGLAPWLLLTISWYQIPVVSRIVTHLSYHYLLLGMCYEQQSDLLSVHSHHFLKRLHCFVETGGHDRMGGTGGL